MLNTDDLNRLEEPFDGRYRLLKLLSSDGATADVWLAADLNTIDVNDIDTNDESSAMLVALKIYRPKNALDIEGEQRFRSEYKIAHECRHPNLLPPESFSIFQDMPYLVVPYCEAGSAEQLIGKPQTLDSIWKFISDVAAGLDRLHTNQPIIIHQDINPANILIDNNQNFAITDFGISSRTSSGSYSYDDNSGTMAYMAPERFNHNYTPSPKSDIWAFGATLCEILTSQVPFGENGGLNQRNNNHIKPSLSHLPPNLRKLIQSCLELDPAKRPTARQIMDMTQSGQRNKKNIGLPVAIALAALLVIGTVVYFIARPKSKPQQYTYEQVEQMLGNKETGLHGKHLLDSLVVEKDYQATFLLSRLYFDISDSRDTAFYDKKWKTMRNNCGITPNNKTAHEYLFKAFTLNDSDPVLLYQLGYDYHSGRRGYPRETDYALWCYEQAERILSNEIDFSDRSRYLSIIQEQKNKILSDDSETHSPDKPTHP